MQEIFGIDSFEGAGDLSEIRFVLPKALVSDDVKTPLGTRQSDVQQIGL